MHAAEETVPHQAAWFVEPDHVVAKPRISAGARVRRQDATSWRAVIVSSMFLVLFTTALTVGGHAAIDPLLRMATAARNNGAVGDVVYSMPDGRFCRHMSYDNATGETIEGAVEPCPDDILGREFHRTGRGFMWGEKR